MLDIQIDRRIGSYKPRPLTKSHLDRDFCDFSSNLQLSSPRCTLPNKKIIIICSTKEEDTMYRVVYCGIYSYSKESHPHMQKACLFCAPIRLGLCVPSADPTRAMTLPDMRRLMNGSKNGNKERSIRPPPFLPPCVHTLPLIFGQGD